MLQTSMRKVDYCDKIFVSVSMSLDETNRFRLRLSLSLPPSLVQKGQNYYLFFLSFFDFSQNIIILRYFLRGTGWFLRSDVDGVLSNVRPERTEMAIGQLLDRQQPRPWFQAHASFEQRREYLDLVQSQRRGKLFTLDQRIGQVPRRYKIINFNFHLVRKYFKLIFFFFLLSRISSSFLIFISR